MPDSVESGCMAWSSVVLACGIILHQYKSMRCATGVVNTQA